MIVSKIGKCFYLQSKFHLNMILKNKVLGTNKVLIFISADVFMLQAYEES